MSSIQLGQPVQRVDRRPVSLTSCRREYRIQLVVYSIVIDMCCISKCIWRAEIHG